MLVKRSHTISVITNVLGDYPGTLGSRLHLLHIKAGQRAQAMLMSIFEGTADVGNEFLNELELADWETCGIKDSKKFLRRGVNQHFPHSFERWLIIMARNFVRLIVGFWKSQREGVIKRKLPVHNHVREFAVAFINLYLPPINKVGFQWIYRHIRKLLILLEYRDWGKNSFEHVRSCNWFSLHKMASNLKRYRNHAVIVLPTMAKLIKWCEVLPRWSSLGDLAAKQKLPGTYEAWFSQESDDEETTKDPPVKAAPFGFEFEKALTPTQSRIPPINLDLRVPLVVPSQDSSPKLPSCPQTAGSWSHPPDRLYRSAMPCPRTHPPHHGTT